MMAQSTSPDADDAASTSQPGGLWETPPTKQDTPDTTEHPSPQNDHDQPDPQLAAGLPRQPMQKRRRVTRACDECRRKKIKCDGKQPCTHCTVYSYECTYDQPSNRRRNAAPQYIEALESQLKRAKALLNAVLPGIDLDDPNLDATIQNGVLPHGSLSRASLSSANTPQSDSKPAVRTPTTTTEGASDGDAQLDSMVRATGQLDLDEQGKWDYHGHSSGFTFMRRMREQFGDIIGPDGQNNPFIKTRPISVTFDSPRSAHESPLDGGMPFPTADLPPKHVARALCETALEDAAALLRAVHLPSFYSSLDKIYSMTPENYGNEENIFLPLLYAVLALGSLFVRDQAEATYETAIEEGVKYFRASRQLLDIADCRDLTSLQAIIFMILFLQSSAKLSTCYSYIGVALRSALRLGLHRSFNDNFNPIEAETRKRVFWVIRKMDTYVGAVLGLPYTMRDEDIDQDFPAEVEDEYITRAGILPVPEGHVSVMHAANAHTKIIRILAKIMQYIYPIKGFHPAENAGSAKSYSVSYGKIREIEKDLEDWKDQLPAGLTPGSGGETPIIIVRVQQLLRIAYGHTQMMLYRPFLHYVSQSCRTKVVDQRAYACATACVSVSRNIVHITSEMKKRGLLVGAYWFTMYTSFFAVLALVFYALENPNNPTSEEVLKDAKEGKDTLAQLAQRSMAADRCTGTLTVLFEQLPERLKRGREMRAPARKRRQVPSPQPPASRGGEESTPDSFQPSPPRRASTFPENAQSQAIGKRPSFPQGYGQTRSSQFSSISSTSSHEGTPTTNLRELFSGGFPQSPSTATSLGFSMYSTPQQSQDSSYPPTPLVGSFMESTTSGLPVADMSAMMFPTGDPLAYPNQAMTTFENNNVDKYNSFKDVSSYSFGPNNPRGPLDQTMASSMFTMPSSSSGALNNDVDVQLFAPTPMIFHTGGNQQQHHHQQQQQQQQLQQRQQQQQQQQQTQFQHQSAQMDTSFSQPGQDIGMSNLDDILRGEDWANTFLDPGPGLGFGGMNMNMGNNMWSGGDSSGTL